MDEIKKWCITVSAVSVISGIILYILPKGKLKGVYASLVGIIMVYALFLPFITKNKKSFSLSEYIDNNDNLKAEFRIGSYEPARLVAEQEIEKSIEKQLFSIGYDVRCEVECKISENNFEVERINVFSKHKNSENEKMKSVISEYTTENTHIYFSEEQNE